ncbi:MAG: tyrosine-type recombinase/integrase [Deltaproteobacteria bacterium]|jgi:integrase|nr:tyrosine-type recombinase/integrase [Deltaproteobacteria bacterium]
MEVYPRGSKFWRLSFMRGDKENRRSLWEYPEFSLQAAREASFDFKRKAKNDTPPEDAPPLALRDLGAEWFDRRKPILGQSAICHTEIIIQNNIMPRLGHIDVNALTPRGILEDLARPIEASGKTSVSRAAVSVLGRILRYGIATGRCERDCTRDLAGALAPHQTAHFNTTSDPDEIARVLASLESVRGDAGAALRILPYVFTRPGELAGAVWQEFDLEEATWRIPPERMKKGRPHIVPLSRQVIGMFEALPSFGNEKGPVFSFGGRTRPAVSFSRTFSGAVGRKGLITPHGFRAMASTILNEMGYNCDWIERQLAHVEGNAVRASYTYAQYLPERRKMMQDWADYLDSLKARPRPAVAACKGKRG